MCRNSRNDGIGIGIGVSLANPSCRERESGSCNRNGCSLYSAVLYRGAKVYSVILV